MTASDTTHSARYGVGPYHQCWYPVALSSELTNDGVIGRDVLDGRVVMYRASDGSPRVLSAYCKHLGADLSVGDLVDDGVRCPFHHWQYDGDGVCRKNATGDRIPESAFVFSYPTAELWDIVWIFNGPEPLYPVPAFPRWDAERMVYRSFVVDMSQTLYCDPWFFGSNAFDFQHLRSLHGMTWEADDVTQGEYSMGYHSEDDTPGAGHWSMDLTMWGTNCVVIMADNEGNPAHHIAASTPFGADGTRFYFVAATEIDPDSAESVQMGEAILDIIEKTNTIVINEDIPVLNTIQPGHRLLVKSDRALAQYFRYAEQFPTASFGELQMSKPAT